MIYPLLRQLLLLLYHTKSYRNVTGVQTCALPIYYDFRIIDNALRCIIPYQHNMRRIYHKFSPQVLQRPAGFVII